MKNIRTCIACRQKFDKTKTNLIKITLKNGEPLINDGEVFGRSLYVCNCENCLNKVIKNKLLNKLLKKEIPNSIYEKINSLR